MDIEYLLNQVEEKLNYSFSNKDLLLQALTHRSVTKGKKIHYENLEFIGDAVLDLAVADLLLQLYPQSSEGELSKMRASLVSEAGLSKIGRQLNLSQYIIVGEQELARGDNTNSSIISDVVEAIFGAIYLDADFSSALTIAKGLFLQEAKEVSPSDPKTELQELVARQEGNILPIYKLVYREGPDHNPTFISVVELNGEVIGEGSGKTKKQSQQNAAAVALEKLKRDNKDSN